MAEQYDVDLKALITKVKKNLDKAQAAYKMAFDTGVLKKDKEVAVRDCVSTNLHAKQKKKLGLKPQGPFMVLQSDGRRFVVKTPKGLRSVSSDRITDASTSLVNDTRWSLALKARTLYEDREVLAQESQQYVVDSFQDHRWTSDGHLKLLVR